MRVCTSKHAHEHDTYRTHAYILKLCFKVRTLQDLSNNYSMRDSQWFIAFCLLYVDLIGSKELKKYIFLHNHVPTFILTLQFGRSLKLLKNAE